MPITKPRCVATLLILIFVNCCTASAQTASKAAVDKAPAVTKPSTDTIASVADSSHTDAFMTDLLKQYPQYFDSILANRGAYNVQVIYTSINRGANGIAALKNYYFNINARHYFYPAAAVQLPVALLTLQRLGELKANGVDKNSTMITQKAFSGQTAVYNDPTTADGKPSIGHYLKKMLMVNNADAFNRLYEFLGQQYINDQLQLKGYTSAQVLQRLQLELTEEENRHTNPVQFFAPGNKLIYQQPQRYNDNPLARQTDSLGKYHGKDEMCISLPMNVEGNNKLTLEDLHQMLISLVFPNKVTSSQRFTVTDDDRKYILQYMSQFPSETVYPPYKEDTLTYYPAYNKYLLYGAARSEIPAGIRIFNKSGREYGQLLDAAYIVDFDKKIEFFLSAVIFCNSDSIPGEDHYEYETTGYPFMKNLGRVIYDYETMREKKNEPDLSEVKFEYDRK